MRSGPRRGERALYYDLDVHAEWRSEPPSVRRRVSRCEVANVDVRG